MSNVRELLDKYVGRNIVVGFLQGNDVKYVKGKLDTVYDEFIVLDMGFEDNKRVIALSKVVEIKLR